MQILHVIASIDPRGGGPIEGLLQQARHRASMARAAPGHTMPVHTHILSLDPPGTPSPLAEVRLFPLGRRRPAGRWARRLPWVHYGYAPDFVPWLRRHARDYDLIIVNGLWNYATLGARRALAGTGTRYVVYTHGMLDPWFKQAHPLKSMLKQVFWLFCEGPLLNRATAVCFTTQDELERAHNAFWPYAVPGIVAGYGTGDIPGGADGQTAAFHARLPALGARPYLLYLSRIHPKKGCDLLIAAFGAIAAGHPGLDLVMAGPDQVGWGAQLRAQAEALGIGDRVHWPGMLAGEAKWGAFRGAAAFVLPSHQENFGIVVAEAMAAGRPVLVSDKVNIWRDVEASRSGLVDTDDGPGTRRLLERFLALPADEREAMGQRARACFLERFDIQQACATIDRLIREAA